MEEIDCMRTLCLQTLWVPLYPLCVRFLDVCGSLVPYFVDGHNLIYICGLLPLTHTHQYIEYNQTASEVKRSQHIQHDGVRKTRQIELYLLHGAKHHNSQVRCATKAPYQVPETNKAACQSTECKPITARRAKSQQVPPWAIANRQNTHKYGVPIK
eukprot:6476479-Amphidinium_carterae.2